MGAIDQLKQRLLSHPQIPYRMDEGALIVDAAAPDGFPVVLEDQGSESRVYCGDVWHEDYEEAEDAIACFLLALSRDARLRVLSRGGADYQWSFLRREGTAWRRVSTVGIFWCRFWCAKQERELQNAWL